MTPNVLMQSSGLNEAQSVVQQYFEKGGSPVIVMVVLIVLVAAALATYQLTRRQNVEGQSALQANPKKLFRDLLGRLDLTPKQRRFLRNASTRHELKNPTVMLICPALFDLYFGPQLSDRAEEPDSPSDEEHAGLIAQIRCVLFPTT